MQKKVCITAGGTGGHIFPALSIAKELLKTGVNISWVGTKSGLESQLVPVQGIRFLTVHMEGIRRKGLRKLLFLPFSLFRACLEAMLILLRERPNVVVGFGGYATFPLCLMARCLAIPIIIHEQNAIFGLSNNILKFISNFVLLSSSNLLPCVANNKYQLVGNPVRDDILALLPPQERYARLDKLSPNKLNLLIVGGSLGASALNNLLPEICANLTNVGRIIHQTGKNNSTKVEMSYAKLGIDNVEVVEFISDMAAAYAQSDLIICRAGAGAVSEVINVGIAAIFIPYPYAVDNHQYYNSLPLVNNGAAYSFNQSEVTVTKLTNVIGNLDRTQCIELANKAYAMATRDSTRQIVEIILGVV